MELFKRGPALGFRFILLVILSIIIMIVDHREHHMERLRSTLSVILTPVQYAVDWPVQFADWVHQSISTHHSLLEENAHLKAQQLLLQAQVQKLIAIEKENRLLRALLKSTPPGKEHVVAARLLAIDSNPYVQQFTLAKGSRDGVFDGQVVLDANGVLGQVILVGPLTSQVLLLTDTRSAIPIEDNRNGVRGVVVGTGVIGKLSLIDMPKTAGVKQGDVLVTSGLGQRFPVGYPVGTVSSVIHNPGDHFAIIEVTPSAQFNRTRLVLLLWPNKKKETKLR